MLRRLEHGEDEWKEKNLLQLVLGLVGENRVLVENFDGHIVSGFKATCKLDDGEVSFAQSLTQYITSDTWISVAAGATLWVLHLLLVSLSLSL